MHTVPRKKPTHTLFGVLIAVMLLAACGPQIATQPPAEPAASATAAADPTSSPVASPPDTQQAPSAVPTDTQASGLVSFSQDLLPLFTETCIKCHGGDKTEKGLDMKSYAALMSGSERGTVVVPGDAASSRLAQLVENGKMPKRGPKLTSEQVQLIVDWINAGAQNN